MLFRAQRIARAYILKSHACAYIARAYNIHGVLVIRVHLEDAADTFFLTRTGIVNIRTGFQFTRINSEVAQTTYVWVSGNLEGQCAKRLILIGLTAQRLFRTRILTVNMLSIHRTRQICAHSIQHSLHTLVLERRTAYHRENVHTQRTLADG